MWDPQNSFLFVKKHGTKTFYHHLFTIWPPNLFISTDRLNKYLLMADNILSVDFIFGYLEKFLF